MYVLLAICLVLHPQKIDESLQSMLNEKNYADKMSKMISGIQTIQPSGEPELSEFEACFTYACPKFLSPVAPNFDSPHGLEANALAHKVRLYIVRNSWRGSKLKVSRFRSPNAYN